MQISLTALVWFHKIHVEALEIGPGNSQYNQLPLPDSSVVIVLRVWAASWPVQSAHALSFAYSSQTWKQKRPTVICWCMWQQPVET